MRIKKNIPAEEIKPGVTTNNESATTEEEVKADAEVSSNADTKQPEPVDEDTSPIAIPGTTITVNKLAALKDEYGKKAIFKTRFIDDIFIWHKLNRGTFASIVAKTKDIEDEDDKIEAREREFVKATLIYPDPANQDTYEDDVLITGLAEEILYRSGFAPAQTERL